MEFFSEDGLRNGFEVVIKFIQNPMSSYHPCGYQLAEITYFCINYKLSTSEARANDIECKCPEVTSAHAFKNIQPHTRTCIWV